MGQHKIIGAWCQSTSKAVITLRAKITKFNLRMNGRWSENNDTLHKSVIIETVVQMTPHPPVNNGCFNTYKTNNPAIHI